MKKIPAGEMRQRIFFQDFVEIDDGYGGKPKSWVDVFSVWAKVEPISGREYFESHQTSVEVTHRIRIRYREGLSEKMRIRFGDRYFEISSILDLEERHEQIEIMASEGK